MAKMFWALCAVMVLSLNYAYAGEIDMKVNAPVPLLKDPTTGMELVYVKGKCFQMGNAFGDGGPEEKPVHEVCLNDFYMGKYEVTQGQWKKVMGSNPSLNSKCGDNCPVENVSWNDVQNFISKLNSMSSGSKYRLPTEAEWEFAARSGGKPELYAGGDVLVDLAWYFDYDGQDDYRWGTKAVGKKRPNGLGIYDMTGNVWEWTSDWYASDYYASSPKNNPTGPASGDRHVLRGGSWRNGAFDLRTSYRNYLPPDYRSDAIGVRLLRIN